MKRTGLNIICSLLLAGGMCACTATPKQTEEISCDYSELDSFVIFICMEGACKIKDNEGNELKVGAGESILLPATTQDVTITPEAGNVKLLETYV